MRAPSIPVLLVASAILLTGCAAQDAPPSRSVSAQEGTAKTGTGELRTDLAPLVDRYPAVVDAESAAWSSGTLAGDDRVPGPSSHWIDAVVVLPQAAYDELRAAHEYTESAQRPSVADALAASVPDGALLVSDELDDGFGPLEGSSDVYLSDSTHSVVIVSVFE